MKGFTEMQNDAQCRRDAAESPENNRESGACLDKVRGCLVGGAAGDALGYPVEFMNETRILSRFGDDGITEFELDQKIGKARISDDTQMTLFTATGCLAASSHAASGGAEKPIYAYVKLHYDDWYLTQVRSFEERKAELDAIAEGERAAHSWLAGEPRLYSRRAPGGTCMGVLGRQLGRTPFEPATHTVSDSKGCGGIMRIAPVGLFFSAPNRDMKVVDWEAANVAALTHGHSLGYMSAAVLAHIVNRLVHPIATLEKKPLTGIVKEARDTVAEMFKGDSHIGELVSAINHAIILANSWDNERECIREMGEGWVAEETLAIAIFCAIRHQDSFSDGIIAAVNHRGDSDSTGAVTGNILGALLGYNGIDDKWKRNLELSDVILKVADNLCHV